MSDPLVTIITPSFNQSQWLESTIQSVLAQTYPNIEYIVIDGGSTDGSQEIIKKYADKIAYWQTEPDGGQAQAINIGYRKSKGVLLAYLNADDLLEPTAVETIIRAYEVNPEFAVYYGKCKTIDAKGNILKAGESSQVHFRFLVKEGMLPNIFQPACFFNKIYLNENQFVDENYKYAFDYNLLLSLSSKKSILFLNRDVASYRIHEDSKSNRFKIEAYKEKLAIQENFSKSDFFLWKWKRLKLAIAERTGKIVNGK
ncbi:MAG: glycosyltransferase [Bacteroidia bacterium]|nr:glycosyltransferase [Bacteroidia bacterium]